MVLTTADTQHLPDLTDLLQDRNAQLIAVEVAQYKNNSINHYAIRYVAGTATIDGIECLIVGTSKTEQGYIVGRELPLLRSLSDYTPLTK